MNDVETVAPESMIRWPPHCCVPAFLHAAMTQFDIPSPDPGVLARNLKVGVGPCDFNPFGLRIEADARHRGVSAEVASRLFNDFLQTLSVDLRLRHVPLSTITHEAYEDVVREALQRSCVVGVGVDPKRAAMPALENHRHVVRVIGLHNGSVVVRDDSSPGCDFETSWRTMETAIFAVGGGVWVVGQKGQLRLPFCPNGIA